MLGLIPGMGLLRKAVTLGLMGAAFWAGLEAERFMAAGRCAQAGGTLDAQSICRGARP